MSAKRRMIAGLMVALLLSSTARSAEPLADRVRASMNMGVAYLKRTQENRGGVSNWENTELFNTFYIGGTSCLATLALLSSGVKPNEPVIERVLPYIRALNQSQTYVIALQTMVLSEVGEAKDLSIIQTNVNWLLDARVTKNGKLVGWSYGKTGNLDADNSNTQYALLGLLAGRQAGIKIDLKDWEQIQQFYIDTRIASDKGKTVGWSYHPSKGDSPTHSMTCAGLSGLFISGLELNVDKQELDVKTGVAAKCGIYAENDTIAKGMKWIDKHFEFDMSEAQHRATFYNVYGVERVGRLSGQRFIGEHDWYREGCEVLCGVKKSALNQKDDGSWRMGGGFDNMSVISTSFTLLFLSKGRTPILLSKLAFDTNDRDDGKDGVSPNWNRKHHDARNVVDYASKFLFKKQPLAWQIFDPRLVVDLDKDDKFKEELSNLLQAPILYLNGHGAPNLSARQIELLSRYVDEGGFIFAEACCGDPAFIDGFTALMKKVFPDSPLVPLRADHPVWSAHMPIDPKSFITGVEERKLVKCIERGCKTVVVFVPQPLAGFWEERQYMPKDQLPPTTRGEIAYRFAGNVIAYATGLEMPKPRLTKVELADSGEHRGVTRHAFELAQINHLGDWHSAPRALRVLSNYLIEHYKLQVTPMKDTANPKKDETNGIRLNEANLMQYKFLYMHGRRDFTKEMEDREVNNLRNNLRTGATLFADACCGAKEFDTSFRQLASKLYPDKKLERIPLEDFLYSEKLNGKAITSVKCRREKADGSAATEYEEMPPELEGIKVGNRWVVIYSKYDIGCALEKSKSSACKGHDHESAKILAAAAVLYALKR